MIKIYAHFQAALAPLVIQFSGDSPADKMTFIFQTCVLSILITAPIGQLLIDLLGRLLLDKEVQLSKRSNLEPLKLPELLPDLRPGFDREPSFIQADRDNRLRVREEAGRRAFDEHVLHGYVGGSIKQVQLHFSYQLMPLIRLETVC